VSLTVGNQVVEVDAAGKVVWELKAGDLPGVPITRTTALAWLPNGNVILSNYAARAPHPKLVEVTRDKQVVWTYVDDSKFVSQHAANDQLVTSLRLRQTGHDKLFASIYQLQRIPHGEVASAVVIHIDAFVFGTAQVQARTILGEAHTAKRLIDRYRRYDLIRAQVHDADFMCSPT
jgi:hypothetical protein